jgi:hypothetical protein
MTMRWQIALSPGVLDPYMAPELRCESIETSTSMGPSGIAAFHTDRARPAEGSTYGVRKT